MALLGLVESGDALDGDVVALGGAAREDDLLGVGTDEIGDLLHQMYRGHEISRDAALTWRARSTAASLSQPYAWLLEWGLPNMSRLYGIIASNTRGSYQRYYRHFPDRHKITRGVVAKLSMYNGRKFCTLSLAISRSS